jgi:hypothetical protein
MEPPQIDEDPINEAVNRQFKRREEENPDLVEAVYHLSDSITTHRAVMNYWMKKTHQFLWWALGVLGSGMFLGPEVRDRVFPHNPNAPPPASVQQPAQPPSTGYPRDSGDSHVPPRP